MHRHGYSGRKFARERGPRKALLRGLAISLVEHGSLETTLPKAKELQPMIEKLVTKARKNNLHNRRQIISTLDNVNASNKLVEQIAPAMKRTSGYTKIARTNLRRGDNTQLAQISFVDPVETTPSEDSTKPKATKTSSKESPTPSQALPGPTLDPNAPKVATKSTIAPKRTGRRGDR